MSTTSTSKEPKEVNEVKETKTPSVQDPAQLHLGILEEDDEFEEFPVADWDDSETDLAHLAGAAPGGAKSGGDKLWEDNWDDDDIEDEFSAQLRNELAKTAKSASSGGDAMQQ